MVEVLPNNDGSSAENPGSKSKAGTPSSASVSENLNSTQFFSSNQVIDRGAGSSGQSSSGAGALGNGIHNADVFKGFLYKWTNYMKGYQRRWFIISGGNIYYYKSPSEVELTCRGSMSLVNCQIESNDESTGFQIVAAQTWHLKTSSEVDKQRWVLALQLARDRAVQDAKASNILAEEEESFAASTMDFKTETMSFNHKLDDVKTLKNLISKHQNEFVKELSALAKMIEMENKPEMNAQVKVVQERATLLKVTSSTMFATCVEFVKVSEDQKKRWERAIKFEKHQISQLQKTIEDMAKSDKKKEDYLQQIGTDSNMCEQNSVASDQESSQTVNSSLESQVEPAKHESNHISSDSETDSFYDCWPSDNYSVEESARQSEIRTSNSTLLDNGTFSIKKTSSIIIGPQVPGNEQAISKSSGDSDSLENDNKSLVFAYNDAPMSQGSNHWDLKVRRSSIPPRPEMSLNLWKILKNCIGKDLSRIPMPVNFNEPLSFLQRLAEDLEYSSLLDTAAKLESNVEQMAYIGAFAVSVFAGTVYRHNKPFNPLLHETFELDLSGDSEGYRLISEQVRHHPPISVQHVEGRSWLMNHQYSMSSAFRGKFLQITPTGVQQIQFKNGNHYIITKPQTIVNNIIVGTLSIYQQGEMLVTNYTTKERLLIKFHVPAFGAATYRISGDILSPKEEVLGRVSGNYNDRIEFADLTAKYGSNSRVIWNVNSMCNEDRYFMSKFAIMLNQEDDTVSPTDSRRRQDVRLLEETKWELANEVKAKMEERQRARRREQMESKPHDYVYTEPPPTWFSEEYCSKSERQIFMYKGGYWNAKKAQDWSGCPRIFD